QVALKKVDEAEKNFRTCIDIAGKNVGVTHPKMVMPMEQLSDLLLREQRDTEALKLQDNWLAAHRAHPGPFLADALTVHAGFHRYRDDTDRERAELEEARALYRREPTPPSRSMYVR